MAGTVPVADVPNLFIWFANRIYVAFILSEEQIAILSLFIGFKDTCNMSDEKNMLYNTVVKVFLEQSIVVSLLLLDVVAYVPKTVVKKYDSN